MNLYAYAGNNPATYTDPFGLSPECGSLGSCLKEFALYQWRGFLAGSDPTRTTIDFATEAQFGALVGRGLLAVAGAGRVTGAGRGAAGAGEPSRGMIAAFERQLAEHGPASVQRSIRSLTRRLGEHEAKLSEIRQAGGHTSSVEREIRTLQRSIEAARRALEGTL
jgi:hypothetical protein